MGGSSCLAFFLLLSAISSLYALEVSHDNRAFKINGERKIIISGSIHYPRSTPGMWPDLIKKAKEGGLNAIETYVFWNAHEPEYRQYDFSGRLDLIRFIKTIQDAGLYAILRIGPYVCAEWNYGGFPVWLHSLPGIEIRTNNEVYKNEMKTFVSLIVDMMKNEKLFAPQGGPIILAQIENEYGNVQGKYREKYGNEAVDGYINWCSSLAQSMQIGVPWIMCQQFGAPSPMVESGNGFYADSFYPKNTSLPKIWTENWSGWFQDWGNRNPHRPAEDLAFAVARFFQRDGTLQNYYMYHGGTNFGNTGGGPYITTSYDYNAPLDELGNLNQPKWGHLKNLHAVLYSMEKALTYGERTSTDYQKNKWVTIYTYQGTRSCFFSNSDHEDQTLTFEGKDYFIPGWSVSILLDCKTEVYNTAKVNAQKSIMVNKPNNAKADNRLQWQWRAEKALHIDDYGLIKGSTLAANELLDQKRATNGTNDYLWVMTNYNHDANDSQLGGDKDIILHVHTNGHVVHAFVNGKYYGRQAAQGNLNGDFIFEARIRLNQGNNRISLVSVTAGLPNYGEFFDTIRTGIRGPIKLIAKSKNGEPDVIKDISSNRWVYKTGLHGEDLGLHLVNPRHRHNFKSYRFARERPFVWYKTTFSAPMGSDPVVVDLLGLGKGTAWINGNNIGRYWPKALAPKDGCDENCDYKGNYGGSQCSTGCGQPTQRYYHIPRDWLQPDNNDLVLFEEFGGNPDSVSIQTVTVGKACAQVYEGHTLELSCQGGRTISSIKFASFGLPNGRCGSFDEGECHIDALPIVQQACHGKESCSIKVSKDAFGSFACHKNNAYRLAVEATC